MTIRFGCQTYTWQMTYDKYRDRFTEILDCIQASGFQGVEAEVCMLGAYYNDPKHLQDALAERDLQLAALTLALPWRQAKETDEEKDEADRLLRYMKTFPDTKLILVQLPGTDRANLNERQNNALCCVNAVARRAAEQGLISAYHPNSPEGSVFRTAEDYEWMFAGLDTRYVGYCPDTGHIANGGMDVLTIFKHHAERIKHVHFKDISMNREWRSMGQGMIDHVEVVSFLRSIDYSGWVMVEEESEQARADPDGATSENGMYVKSALQSEEGLHGSQRMEK